MAETPPTPGDLVNDTAGAVAGPMYDALREIVPVLLPWLLAFLVFHLVVSKFLPAMMKKGGFGDLGGYDGPGGYDDDDYGKSDAREYRRWAREARQDGDSEQARYWSRKAQAAARTERKFRQEWNDSYNGQSSW